LRSTNLPANYKQKFALSWSFRCDQICNNQFSKFSHTLLLYTSPNCLWHVLIWLHLKLELSMSFCSTRFSWRLRHDQIHNNYFCKFSHTLLLYLCPACLWYGLIWLHLKLEVSMSLCSTNLPLNYEQKFALSLSFRCDQICNSHFCKFSHTLLLYLSPACRWHM
jgi:hypothetical protein